MEEYTIKSAHLVSQKNDQNLSNVDTSNEKRINKKLPQTNTIKCKIVAFLRLYKSTQKRKNITDAIIIMN
jgi:hypothetical protein